MRYFIYAALFILVATFMVDCSRAAHKKGGELRDQEKLHRMMDAGAEVEKSYYDPMRPPSQVRKVRWCTWVTVSETATTPCVRP